jgi:hypothetical protein
MQGHCRRTIVYVCLWPRILAESALCEGFVSTSGRRWHSGLSFLSATMGRVSVAFRAVQAIVLIILIDLITHQSPDKHEANNESHS